MNKKYTIMKNNHIINTNNTNNTNNVITITNTFDNVGEQK